MEYDKNKQHYKEFDKLYYILYNVNSVRTLTLKV